MSNIAAVPVVNRKGQLSMQPTKVERYRQGKIPSGVTLDQDEDFDESDEDEEDMDSIDPHEPLNEVEVSTLRGVVAFPTHSTTISTQEDEDMWTLHGHKKKTLHFQSNSVTNDEDTPNPNPIMAVPIAELQKDRRFKRLMAIQASSERRFDLPSTPPLVDTTTSTHILRQKLDGASIDVDVAEITSKFIEHSEEEDQENTQEEEIHLKSLKIKEPQEIQHAIENEKVEEINKFENNNEKDKEIDEEEEEEDEEYDEDDDDEEEEDSMSSFPLVKPMFVPKHARQSIQVEDSTPIYTTELDPEAHSKRQQETKHLLEEEIKRSLLDPHLSQGFLIDDTDDVDDAEEYEKWKQRELARLIRDYEERGQREREREYLEQRRNRSLQEKMEETKQLRQTQKELQKQRPKMKFLQRYYHKGAFYLQDAPNLMERNYAEATLEDHFHKELLPEVLQKRHQGKSSQSKWTHLSKEDTSKKESGWYQDKIVARHMEKKRGGMGDIDQPTKHRRT
ncbi:Microfibrillar-associated protein 1 [Coelomomyces lativittatus]|nr:Microfibrillar-associated protein 1 [Coelomomyces lativittatus]KAJ1510400.1 Microfibrillar-associated protein 1 [Coelomomyces lativittatus]KAJ1511967.1 Microfibrillar-associated protein 1 [Coelomomyces lativittatus]